MKIHCHYKPMQELESEITKWTLFQTNCLEKFFPTMMNIPLHLLKRVLMDVTKLYYKVLWEQLFITVFDRD